MLKVILSVFLVVPSFAGVVHIDDATKKKNKSGIEVRFLATPKEQKTKSAFMAHMTIPAGAKVPVHKDKSEEYIYVLEGEGMVWINGGLFPVKAGSSVFMPADAEVSFINGPKETKVIQFFAPLGAEKRYEKW